MTGYVEPGNDAAQGAAADEQGGRKRRRRPELTPVQRALALLTRREHSGRELTRKLVARGVPQDQAESAVARLADDGWQDDARFAEVLVRTRANAGYGPIHIRAELGTHGLDTDSISTAMDSFEGDWTASARDLVERRFGATVAADRALQRKAADFLMRRGFAGVQVRAAISMDSCDD